MRLKKTLPLFISFFVLILCFSFSSSASAKTGDFYKQHQKVIEKNIGLKANRDFIKSYDYTTNTFDCGTFDLECKINGIQYKSVIGAIKLSYQGISNFVITPSEITGNSQFKKYKNALAGFSTTMLAIFLMWHVMKIVASRYADSSDGAIAINDKLIMVLVCGILLGIYDDFFVWVLQFQEVAVGAVLNDPVKTEDIVLITFLNGDLYGLVVAIMIMLVMLIFAIAFMYRFVLFGLLYIVGVIAIPTGLNDEYNFFSIWLRQLISNGVTLFLQAISFSLGFQALVKNNAFSQGASFTVAMAFFILALTIPGLLGQLGASSGSSRAIGSIARHATRRG